MLEADGAAAPDGLTRRRLLQAGGAAALLAAAGPVADARAATLRDGARLRTPRHLQRTPWLGLRSRELRAFAPVRGRLELLAVGDVLGARRDAALRRHEEAFVLTFAAPAELGTGRHWLVHPQLGEFELFLVEVGAGTGERWLEAVVDRSVRPERPRRRRRRRALARRRRLRRRARQAKIAS